MPPTNASSKDRDAVQEFFTGNAADYANLFLARQSGSNFGFRERLNLAVQMTSGVSGRFLDCACGSGEITAAILSSGRFTGATVVDLSPVMLKAAQQRMEIELAKTKMDRLEFISSDIFEFTLQPQIAPYDLILCLGLIAHTGRLDELLRRLKTILSPTGCILLQSSLLDHVGTKIVRFLKHERYYRQHGYRISYFHHRDILRSAQNAGLEAIEMQRFTFGFPFGDRISARANYHLEKTMRGPARVHGAEALYLLQPHSSQN